MSLDQFYQLEHAMNWSNGSGEEMKNIYFYRSGAGFGDATAEELLNGFFEDVLPFVLGVQSAFVDTTRITVVNLGDPMDFSEAVYTALDGTFTESEALPPFAALNYTLRLSTRAIRPGSKRIPGIPASVSANGIVTSSPYLAAMETLRTKFVIPIGTHGGTEDVFSPVVIKRVPYTTGEGNPAYRLPETDGELEFGFVVTALTSPRLSHQTSRGNSR